MVGLQVIGEGVVARKYEYPGEDGQQKFGLEVMGMGWVQNVFFDQRAEWAAQPEANTPVRFVGRLAPGKNGLRVAEGRVEPVKQQRAAG